MTSASERWLAEQEIPEWKREQDLRAQRSRAGKIGASSRWATGDGREGTRKARNAQQRGFEDQVDPDRTLAPEERARRVAHAKRVHFTNLSKKAAAARRAKAGVS